MAAEFVEYLTPNAVKSTSTTISFGLAAGSAQQANDILFVWVFWDNATSTTPGAGTLDKPAGETNNWTLVNHSNSSNSSAGVGVISELWEIRTTMVWPRQQYNVPQSGTQTSAKGVVGAVVRGVSFTPANTYFGTASASMNVFTGDLTLGVASYQASSAGTGDTDTSMGPWDAGSDVATTGGKGDTNVAGRIQYKLQTADDFAIYNTATISYHTGLLRLKPLAGTTTPPTGVQVSTNLPEQVALVWDDLRANKADGGGFEVLRNGVVIGDVTNASATQWDTQATYRIEYPAVPIDVDDSYTVRSYEPEIHMVGPESAPLVGRAVPSPVRDFGGYPLSLTSNRLAWSPYAYDSTVRVYRDGSLVHTVVLPAGTAGSWDDTGLTTGQAYSYTASSTVGTTVTDLVGPVVITPQAMSILRPTSGFTGGTAVGAATGWQAISDGAWGDAGPGAFGSYWQMSQSSQNTTATFDTSQIPAGKWVKAGAILGYCVDGVDYSSPLAYPRDQIVDQRSNRAEVLVPLAPNPPRDYNSTAFFSEEGNQLWLTTLLSDAVAKQIGTAASFNVNFYSVSNAMKVAQFAIMVAYEDAIVAAPTNVSVVSAVGDQITLAFDPVVSASVIGYTAKIGNVYSRVDQLTGPITFTGSTLGGTGVSVQLFAHSSTGRLGPGSTVISGVVATPHAPRSCCAVTNGDGATQSSLGVSISWADPIRVHETWNSGAPVYQTNIYQDGVLLTTTPLGTTIREYQIAGPLTIGQEYTFTARHVANGLEGEPAVVKYTPLHFVTIKANSEIYRSPSTTLNYQTVVPTSSPFEVASDPWGTYTGPGSYDHQLFGFVVWDVFETGGEVVLGYARIEDYGGVTYDPAPSNLAPPVVGQVWRGPLMIRIDFYSIGTYADDRGDRALAFAEVLYGPDDIVLVHQSWGNSNFASVGNLTIFRHVLVPEDKVALIQDFNQLKLRLGVKKLTRSPLNDAFNTAMSIRGFSARLAYGDPVAPTGPAPFAAFGIPL